MKEKKSTKTVLEWYNEQTKAPKPNPFGALEYTITSKEKIEFIDKYPLLMRPKDVCEFLGITNRKLNQMRIGGEMAYYILPSGTVRYLNLDIWEVKHT